MGWVVICLNAMRIGLLTRFMGVLGVICGALIVLPILSPLPIVQTFWLGAMAVLLAKRWPNGVPPAWTTGEAVPWPSQAEVREKRRAEMQRRRRGGDTGATRTEPAAPRGLQEEEAQAAHPDDHRSQKKRKRLHPALRRYARGLHGRVASTRA